MNQTVLKWSLRVAEKQTATLRQASRLAPIALSVLIPLVWAQSQVPKQAPKTNTKLIHSVKGNDLFIAHCAACHGADGKGHGPVAPVLRVQVRDLTTVAQRNGGQFPVARINRVISGDEGLTSHGSREMPIWGPIFHQVERDQDWGAVRLDNLVKYLQSIQKP